MITIVNYGLGNLGSIQNMLRFLGVPSLISSEPEDILKASKLILPGVGSFDSGINNIKSRNLWNVLNDVVLGKKIKTLGICLGMQLMTKGSEEGQESGLSWIDGYCKKFKPADKLRYKTPHMGWNYVSVTNDNNLVGDEEKNRFYFVHSYYVDIKNEEQQFLSTTYEKKFSSGIFKDNIYGVQFHPEKSHKFGKTLLSNFIKETF